MVLRPGATHYEPIDWDDAFALIARELRALDSPDEAIFYTSGRTSNEAAFLYQLFVRAFGTNNLPDCSNMCHESSGAGLKETLGVGKGTVQLDDFELADAIFVVGQNPGTNHPRMLTTLEAAAKRGATIVSVNPLAEVGTMRFAHPQNPLGMLGEATPLARLHVHVRINGDVAFFQGVMKAMLEEERRSPGPVIDHAFIAEHTEGFDALVVALEGADLGARSRPPAASPRGRHARRGARGRRVARHHRLLGDGAHAARERRRQRSRHRRLPAAARHHGQARRGRVPGARPLQRPGRPHDGHLGEDARRVPRPPRARVRLRAAASPRPGHRRRRSTRCSRDAAKSSSRWAATSSRPRPTPSAPAEALRGCRLTAHVSTKLNRAHLVDGQTALILPCLGRTEVDVQAGAAQFVTVEDSMGIVHASRGGLPPAGARAPERDAHRRPARAGHARRPRPAHRLGGARRRLRPHPRSHRAGRAGLRGVHREGAAPGGLPPAQRGPRARVGHGHRQGALHGPRSARARARSRAAPHDDHAQPRPVQHDGLRPRRPLPRRPRRPPRRAHERRRRGAIAASAPETMWTSPATSTTASASPRTSSVVPYAIPRGCCATYFPEANVLVPLGAVARKSNTPASKSVVVTVARSAAR